MQHPLQTGYQEGGLQHTDKACREFSATGRCKWGANCRFSHDTGPRQQDMHRGASAHRGNLCTQWVNTGRCSFGANCRFAHGEPHMPQYPTTGIPAMPQQQQTPMQQQSSVQAGPPQHYSNIIQQQLQMPNAVDHHQMQRAHSSGVLMTPGPPHQPPETTPQVQQQPPPQQQQQQQQQPPQQQQQQGPLPNFCLPKPGKPTYVDCVRAICEALNIGNCGELVTDETRAAALRSFYTRALFRESRFADGVEQYLPAR